MHSSIIAAASHYNCSYCLLLSLSLIPLLPPPSSSFADHTHRHCFSLPSRVPSCCSTYLPSLPYTSLVAPSHAILYAAPALVVTSFATAACHCYHYASIGDDTANISFQCYSNTNRR
ncbi:hypothetical protein B296_00027973 [Ensete ventricosum]|uniref:Uncharacterized protein n=1 Tax=Ensete ventricosum TaxID=4639 RepID=A0A426YLI4_ENSVE|nr:hypothetical protein B296_00027973 [Ensete ventricosum]